jgi:hypothetical protein
MTFARWVLILCLSSFSIPAMSTEFPPINADELKMTGIPEQPGAPAVILYREETDNDMMNEHTVYERIKILTDAGREHGNVEIPYSRRGFSISGISGQTVHPDGTVIPFTGKPFDKTVLKSAGYKVNVKSFSLPDVQVGSVIDYRYSLRYDDHTLLPPTWEVQTDLFQRKAYFKFVPFQNHGSMYIQLAHGQIAQGIAWDPIVGNGVAPELHQNPLASSTLSTGQISTWVDLKENNIPPLVEEPYMPPVSILRWRVHFYYQEARDVDDYWKTQGKFWNKDVESFVGKDRGISAALARVTAQSDTPEQKVHKIYIFVSQLENQDYVPERTKQEEKVLDLRENRGSDDVLEHHSGSHDDLNRLFVSMVRAAGIPASLIWVPDRSHDMFVKQFLSTRQLDAEIAIVQLNGKDVFLDPGSKFCPYGIVDWRYSGISGLRQSAKGAEISDAPFPTYTQSVVTRMAILSLDENGAAHGSIGLVFKGLEAMQKRQQGGKTDVEGRKKLLEDDLREILPGNSDISLTGQPDWDNAEAPFVAQFKVSFPFAVISGKRLLVQQHLFQVSEHNHFSTTKRINPVYFHYPWQEADEVHITVPAGLEIESLPPDDKLQTEYALYQVKQKQEMPNKIFSRRDFIMNGIAIPPDHYTEMKGFFDKVKADDDQPALLKVGSNVASSK